MFETYSGATRIVPLIGYPIEQAKSPFGVTQGFAARGADIIVVPVKVPPDAVQDYLRAIDRVENIAGVLATVPYKFTLCAHAASATARARFFGSANAMRRDRQGRWQADMLDGLGFMRAIVSAGGTISGRRALMAGAGGAGGAIAFELLNSGASSIAIHDTDTARRDDLIRRLNAYHPGRATAGSAAIQGFDIVINATPLGMKAGDPVPLNLDGLSSAVFVGDVVTAKESTPLIRAATQAGCRSASGHDMFQSTLDLMLDFFLDDPA